MGTLYTRKYGFQIRISNKLLPKVLWATFDTREAAEQYMNQLEALLAQGIVPTALLDRSKPTTEIWTLQRCVLEYTKNNPVPLSERKLLDTIMPTIATVQTNALNYEWADAWIRSMKRQQNLAPSTIRHRHGALARCLDWMLRKHPTLLLQNPLRLLKRGFATYTPADADALAKRGLAIRVDEERDRRLYPDEEARILAQFDLQQMEERVFFEFARDTAMRMRACYTLELGQVALKKRTIHLDRTKNGDRRQVPLPSTIIELLSIYLATYRDAIAARDGRCSLSGTGSGKRRSLMRQPPTSHLDSLVFSWLRKLAIFIFTICGMKQPVDCMNVQNLATF